jgi:hypothetical protein
MLPGASACGCAENPSDERFTTSERHFKEIQPVDERCAQQCSTKRTGTVQAKLPVRFELISQTKKPGSRLPGFLQI